MFTRFLAGVRAAVGAHRLRQRRRAPRPPRRSPSTSPTWPRATRPSRRPRRSRSARPGTEKVLPLLEALREGSVYVRDLPGGRQGDRDRRRQGVGRRQDPRSAVRGVRSRADPGPDGKPMLVELSSLQEVSGRTQLAAGAASAHRRVLRSERPGRSRSSHAPGRGDQDGEHGRRKRRCPFSKARSPRRRIDGSATPSRRRSRSIRLRTGSDAERAAAAARLGALRSANGLERLSELAADAQTPAPLQAGGEGRGQADRALGDSSPRPSRSHFRACRSPRSSC